MSATDSVFVPGAFGRSGITPTVGLAIPLYVIKGTFRHPITNADTPLPPHHWVLAEITSGNLISVSGQSDAGGVCVINDVSDPGQGGFVLGFVPAPQDVRDYLIDHNEAWIDLDTGTWASPQPDRGKLDARNLYRIPAWTTRRKARRGGGLKSWPDKARPETKDTGVLEREDVLRKPFGSKGAPWEIPIDFNWIRATVRYRYFDWARDKENTLPPGLFVDAVPAQPDSVVERVGSGAALKDGDGSAFLLIEADPSRWTGIQFQFRAPPDTRVDLTASEPAPGAKDTRLTAAGVAPTDPTSRNLLPTLWHSLGQRCSVTSGGKTYAREWTNAAPGLVRDKATDVVVEYHLDDVQLVNNDGGVRDTDNGRPALFDHFLAIIDPVASRPHLSDTNVVRSFLLADKAYTVGKGALASGQRRLDRCTRLIHLEGHLFDLRDDRVMGTLGKSIAIGARAAVKDAHLFADYGGSGGGNPFLENEGFYQVHLVDVPGVTDPLAGKPLMHLLLYVSCKIDAGKLAASDVDDFYGRFTEAAERWSQGSPGVSVAKKDYRIVSKDSSHRDTVIRPRAYFGEAKSGQIMDLDLETGGNRSSTGDGIGRWLRFIATPTMKYFDKAIAFDKGRLGGTARDADGVFLAWHTLAHEFGHVFGLPDEYGEELDPSQFGQSITNPRVLTYPDRANEGMPTDYRPFYADRFAQMNQNTLPRLRHFWHFVESLNKDPAFNKGKGIAGAPFVIRHETLGGGIECVHPVDEHKHPYAPLFSEKKIPGGHGDCALFPVGQDEGVAAAMFSPPGLRPRLLPSADRFDGLLIVRSRVRFRFDSAIVKPAQWRTIWVDFVGRLYDENHVQSFRFALVGGAKLSRIAVFVQPHFEVGAAPFTSDHIEFIVSQKVPPGASPFAGAVGDTIHLDITQFDAFCAVRAILGAPTSVAAPGAAPAPNTAPLVPGDFANLVKLLDTEVGGSHTVVPF